MTEEKPMTAGKAEMAEAQTEKVDKITANVRIVNKLGLHARAAAQLVAVASQFNASSRLQHEGRQADCKSIISLLMLAAGQGAPLTLTVQGQDATAACEAIAQLIQERFNEGE